MEYIENYQELAAGIAKQAIRDLTRAYKTLNKIKRITPTYTKGKKELDAEGVVYECESFFRSSWFTELFNLDGEKIIQACMERAQGKETSND